MTDPNADEAKSEPEVDNVTRPLPASNKILATAILIVCALVPSVLLEVTGVGDRLFGLWSGNVSISIVVTLLSVVLGLFAGYLVVRRLFPRTTLF